MQDHQTQSMIAIDDALACYRDTVSPLDAQAVPACNALHHVLAAPARAGVNLPPFAQTALDGYALRSADTTAASPENPAALAVAGEIAAGVHETLAPIEPAQCLRILTGAPLPPGCDAVVAQERVDHEHGSIIVSESVASGGGINQQAEELRQGDPLGQAGQRVTPGLMAALVKAGVTDVEGHRRPRISVLVTGDEIVPAGRAPRPLRHGQIHDANGPLIRAWLHDKGYPEPAIRFVRDDAAAVEVELDAALNNSDLVLTNGGVSVGDHDYIIAAAERIGAERLFWRVAQKPGKPLYFARRGASLLLGLPGNPGSVLTGLTLHVRCVLDCLEGVTAPGPVLHPGRLAEALQPDPLRERLVRAHRDQTSDGTLLTPLPGQASHMLSNLESADALVRVPAGAEAVAAGTLLSWTPL